MLVVDDDPHVRALVSRTVYQLVGTAVEVLIATDIVEAQAIQEATPADVILSDCFLPDVDGPELVKRLKARYPKLKVFLMTGDANLIGRTFPESRSPVRDKADLGKVIDEAVQAALEGL
jgi:CheY-like chemotaxis protein